MPGLRRRRGPWTDAENRRLRELDREYPIDLVALKLWRPISAVRRQLKRIRRRHTYRGRRVWTQDEIAALRRMYPDVGTPRLAQQFGRDRSSLYAKARALGLRKSAAFYAGPDANRFKPGSTAGTAYRFPKGHVPANKGLRRPGYARGRMRETQFRKGQLNGVAAKRWFPVGSTRIADGYVYRKIADRRAVPWTRNWRLEHLLVWERAHGRVPRGHAVAFKDGDATNTALDNLELVSRRDLMRRNSLHNYPPQIVQLIQLRGALNRRINRKVREREEQAQ